MISFDIDNMFTLIPLNKTFKLAADKLVNCFDNKLEKSKIFKLLKICTKNLTFRFYKNKYYKQVNGVSMG